MSEVLTRLGGAIVAAGVSGPLPSASSTAGAGPGSLVGLFLMAGGVLLILLVVAGGNLHSRWQRSRAMRPPFDEGTVEASAGYQRYLAASAWTSGSARNWDYSVRPVLAELVEITMVRRYGAAADPRDAARELLGPELWPLVDREVPRSRDDSVASAGRTALVKILDKLEAGGAG